MMFGHDDQQPQDNATPIPDSTLGQDAASATQPIASESESNGAAHGVAGSQPAPYMSDDSSNANVPVASNDGDLMHIKQQALSQLSPLLGHLEQTPEEKFRTMMMLIQASDNDKLIPQAYEAAQSITDEKARAQALLDVVNEINYFTQQAESAGL